MGIKRPENRQIYTKLAFPDKYLGIGEPANTAVPR